MKPREQQLPYFASLVVALLLFFGAYMGLYYGLLQRKAAINGPVTQSWRFVPSYRHRNELCAVAFYPANCVDRLLRPAYWTELRGWDELAPPS